MRRGGRGLGPWPCSRRSARRCRRSVGRSGNDGIRTSPATCPCPGCRTRGARSRRSRACRSRARPCATTFNPGRTPLAGPGSGVSPRTRRSTRYRRSCCSTCQLPCSFQRPVDRSLIRWRPCVTPRLSNRHARSCPERPARRYPTGAKHLESFEAVLRGMAAVRAAFELRAEQTATRDPYAAVSSTLTGPLRSPSLSLGTFPSERSRWRVRAGGE